MEQTPALIRIAEVMRRAGYRRSQIYQMEREGRFPRHVTLGPRASAWVDHEIDAWVAERINARDAKAEQQRRQARKDAAQAAETRAS
jgi:prophage regulatory protein